MAGLWRSVYQPAHPVLSSTRLRQTPIPSPLYVLFICITSEWQTYPFNLRWQVSNATRSPKTYKELPSIYLLALASRPHLVVPKYLCISRPVKHDNKSLPSIPEIPRSRLLLTLLSIIAGWRLY